MATALVYFGTPIRCFLCRRQIGLGRIMCQYLYRNANNDDDDNVVTFTTDRRKNLFDDKTLRKQKCYYMQNIVVCLCMLHLLFADGITNTENIICHFISRLVSTSVFNLFCGP